MGDEGMRVLGDGDERIRDEGMKGLKSLSQSLGLLWLCDCVCKKLSELVIIFIYLFVETISHVTVLVQGLENSYPPWKNGLSNSGCQPW